MKVTSSCRKYAEKFDKRIRTRPKIKQKVCSTRRNHQNYIGLVKQTKIFAEGLWKLFIFSKKKRHF
jgi:hypothetical protein